MEKLKYPKITLLQDRVLLMPIQERMSQGGILLPFGSEDIPQTRGYVMAVGEDFDDRVVPGDIVHYRGDDCVKIEVEGVEYDLIRESGIFMVETPEAKDPREAVSLLNELYEWGLAMYEWSIALNKWKDEVMEVHGDPTNLFLDHGDSFQTQIPFDSAPVKNTYILGRVRKYLKE
jgi:co-chaperonin GroES (HSP10)